MIDRNVYSVAQTRFMNPVSALWIVRSKDEEVLALFEADSFRSLYEYAETTWPSLLRTDSISAMRIR